MPASYDSEAAALKRFTSRYEIWGAGASRLIDMEVCGADLGTNGYTTMAQADALVGVLRLRPGVRLLDIGAGLGWPSLYLAAVSGCEAVVTDIPATAIRDAAQRAEKRRLNGRASFAVASAVHLPFHPRSFDAIVHTDTL